MAKSDKKFREFILLICARSAGDKKFGSIKLNKLLFYADFSAYLTFGKAITGEEYFKLPKGPAPRRLLPTVEKMKQNDELAYEEIRYFGHTQKKPIALRQPDLAVFTPQEIDLVHTMIKKFWDLDAFKISEKSHLFLGWKAARNRETIPYSTALIGSRGPTSEEQAYGLELVPLAKQCLSRANG